MTRRRKLGLLSRIPGFAGPAGFQRRFRAGLEARGVEVDFEDLEKCDAVLVVGGTRRLLLLERIRRSGIPILQRLDGINWIHRFRPTGLRHYVRAELNNLLLRWARYRADGVIYQSHFVKGWWEREFGACDALAHVVHNGVPLDRFSPRGPGRPPSDRVRVALVEGHIGGGYEVGLDWGVELVRRLRARVDRNVELSVAGAVERNVKAGLDRAAPVRWEGVVAPDYMPVVYRSAHLLFSADLHPACPNAVIEALACGLPVVAFATGAIPELVAEGAGVAVDYGADPWRVETPDLEGLAAAAQRVLRGQAAYRREARVRAEAGFGLDRMVDGYLEALGWNGGGA